MMHLDSRLMRAVVIAAAILLLYGSRLTKGSVRQTPEGPAFGVKPIFAFARAIALPAYLLFFIYITSTQRGQLPWWMALLFVAAIGLGLLQMPGTIVLTPTAITQHFWLQPDKKIQYSEVMAMQAIQGGRMLQVLGDNRVKITHTSNHCAALEFRHEIEQRTGKRVIV
jgi:hypothetical protein